MTLVHRRSFLRTFLSCFAFLETSSWGVLHSHGDEMVLLGHTLTTEVSALKEEVENLARSRGYMLSVVPLRIERPRPVNARTRFVDDVTIEISIAPDQTDEIFNVVLAEELVHAWQNVRHYPKVKPKPGFDTQQTREFGDALSTRVMDVHAHIELRKRGFSTRALGLETYENDRMGLLSSPAPPGTDELSGFAKYENALIYMRLYFELHQDPEIPPGPWRHVDEYFKSQLPQTRELGLRFISIIQQEGLDEPSAAARVLRQMMESFKYKDLFIMFGGPPGKPAYVETF